MFPKWERMKHELTLEDDVRETLRPRLKSWLDENLPRLVEQMVQAETSLIFIAPRDGFGRHFCF